MVSNAYTRVRGTKLPQKQKLGRKAHNNVGQYIRSADRVPKRGDVSTGAGIGQSSDTSFFSSYLVGGDLCTFR
jgi:hypothetical protein